MCSRNCNTTRAQAAALPVCARQAGLLFFFLFPLVSYGAVKGGENVVRVARSLVPLGMVVLRPSYGHVLVSMRAALTAAMRGLVDEQGWVMPETPPQTPPQTPPGSADADRLVEPPTASALTTALAAKEPSTRLSLSDHRMLEEMHGEAAEAAKVKLSPHSARTRASTGLQL